MINKTTEATIIQYLLILASQVKKGGDLQSLPYGITTQQWLILLHLANDPNMPFFNHRKNAKPVLASELADFLNVSRANITNLLNVLQEKGLVIQTENKIDRRKKVLELTAQGTEVIAALEQIRHAANDRLFASFQPEEKERFLEYIQRCFNHLSNVLR